MAIDPNESRKRRMEANYLISLEDPGRFAPQTRQTLATFAANAGIDQSKRLRDHEMAMLQQQGQNAIALEQAHAATLRGQGAEAAEINAGATKYKADADKETAMKQWEVEAAKAKGQFGYFDDTGKYVPGSDVTAAQSKIDAEKYAADKKLEGDKYAADAKVDAVAEGNKGIEKQAIVNRQLEDFKAQNAKELAILKIKGQLPNRQEVMAWGLEKDKPENANLDFQTWLLRRRGMVAGM